MKKSVIMLSIGLWACGDDQPQQQAKPMEPSQGVAAKGEVWPPKTRGELEAMIRRGYHVSTKPVQTAKK